MRFTLENRRLALILGREPIRSQQAAILAVPRDR
jgi:hypothetical protein